MRISALRRRALASGVGETELDQADDAPDRRAEIVRLVVLKETADPGEGGEGGEAALRAELAGLRTRALRDRALACGVSEDELDEADDHEDCRAAFIELIVQWE